MFLNFLEGVMSENMFPQFDRATCEYVIRKLKERAWLCTMLFMVVGLWFATSPFAIGKYGEISFIFFLFLSMLPLYLAVSCSQKQLSGNFGKILLDIIKIDEVLEEEKHWWGRRIF